MYVCFELFRFSRLILISCNFIAIHVHVIKSTGPGKIAHDLDKVNDKIGAAAPRITTIYHVERVVSLEIFHEIER